MVVGRLSCNFCGIEILSMCFLFMPFSQVQDFLRWTIWVNRALEMPISRSIGKTVLHITSAFLMCTTLILLIHIFRNILNTRKYIEQTPSQFLCMQASGWLKTFSDWYISRILKDLVYVLLWCDYANLLNTTLLRKRMCMHFLWVN